MLHEGANANQCLYAFASRASMFQKSRRGRGEPICPLSDHLLEDLIPYSSNVKKQKTENNQTNKQTKISQEKNSHHLPHNSP